MDSILVTGAAGFIGFHLSRKLLREGYAVTGVDNLNDYYSTQLKLDRLKELMQWENFTFHRLDISNRESLESVFRNSSFRHVYHLAAQAGVRHSIEHPGDYIESNLAGFANILECCRHHPPKHLVYASSSSVYGMNTRQPYSVHDDVSHPVSLYAATKKSNELMAHSYSHLYGLPTTGLRFFTVYGPWGRPDMAYYKFVRRILSGEKIELYNKGDMSRDFTYIDDIVEALFRLRDRVPEGSPEWDPQEPDPAVSSAPYRIFNIGNNAPVHLMEFVNIIQETLGEKASIDFAPMQPGDVKKTWADSSDLYEVIDYSPDTSLEEGIGRFVDWYREYYHMSASVLAE